MTEKKNGKLQPEPFSGGTIYFTKAGEGDIQGQFRIWPDSVKFRGLQREEIKLPAEVIRVLVDRINRDQELQEWLGVTV